MNTTETTVAIQAAAVAERGAPVALKPAPATSKASTKKNATRGRKGARKAARKKPIRKTGDCPGFGVSGFRPVFSSGSFVSHTQRPSASSARLCFDLD